MLEFRAAHLPKHISVKNVEWSYLSGGCGKETIVFLPGGLGLAEAWFQIVASFEQDYRTIAITYPNVATIKELADGVAGILNAEGVSKAHILGTSMGGMLAQCFVRLYPEKVDRLILANTAAPDKAYAGRIEKNNQKSSRFPMWLIRFASIRVLGKHMQAIPRSEREFWKAYFKEAIYQQWNQESITRQNQCIVDFARNCEFSASDLAAWPGKILIIASDDDQAIRADLGTAMRDLYPGAQIHTFHNAGHIPLITRRAEYIAVIGEFLRHE